MVAGAAGRRIDGYFRQLAQQNLFYGSVSVYRQGQLLVSRGYGWANLTSGVRDAPSTRYKIASMTKQFTAMAIMQLQEMHRLSIHDSVCRYITDCPSSWKPVRLRNLLDMTSGIPDFVPATLQSALDDPALYRLATPDAVITAAKKKPLQFVPGAQWRYDSLGYVMLARIIETVSGQSYASFLEQHIFQPLDMKDTGVIADGHPVRGLATGYKGQVAMRQFASAQQLGTGDLYSTAGDLDRWDRALSTTKLVSRRSLDEIFKAQWVFAPHPGASTAFHGYGYGWYIGGTVAGHRYIEHDGTLPGFLAANFLFPAEDVHIIIVSNQFRWLSISGEVEEYVASQALKA